VEPLLETTGVIFGLFSVWYAVRAHNATWWTGTVNSLVFGVLFFKARLYVNVILQIIYVFYNLYGAYMWRYGGRNRTAPAIALTPAAAWGVMLAAGVVATWLVGHVFAIYTDNPQPYWDATTVGLSLVAQYMLAQKWLENWWVWIVSNVIYLGLCAVAALYQIAGLQVVYIVLSVMGYLAWRKEWRGAENGATSLPTG
jgi:nicotinamide mononucleotide transporter